MVDDGNNSFFHNKSCVIGLIAAVVLGLLLLGTWHFWLPRPRSIHVERVVAFAEHSDPFTVAATGAGTLLAVSDFKHNRRIPTEVIIWNMDESRSPVCTFEGPETQCHALSFHPDGTLLAMGGEGGFVRIADVRQRAIVQQFEVHGGPPTPERGIDLRSVLAMEFSPNGEVLAVGTGRREIEIWATADWQRLRTLPRHSHKLNDLAFGSDGSLLISVGGWRDEETMKIGPEVFVWNSRTWKRELALKPKSLSSSVAKVCSLGDGLAVVGDYHSHLSLINIRTGEDVRRLVGHENMIGDLAYDSIRNLLISTSPEKTIVWDLNCFAEVATLPGSTFVAYAPETGLLATAFSKTENTCVLSNIAIVGER